MYSNVRLYEGSRIPETNLDDVTADQLKGAMDHLLDTKGVQEDGNVAGVDFLIPGEPFECVGEIAVCTDMYEHQWYRLRREETEEGTKYQWGYREFQDSREPNCATISFRGDEVFYERPRSTVRQESMREVKKLELKSIQSFYGKVTHPDVQWREQVLQECIHQDLPIDPEQESQDQTSRVKRFIAKWLRPSRSMAPAE